MRAPEHAAAPRPKRKLAAILSADVKSYSRLMGADEAGTLRTLIAHREAMDALITRHEGRVIGSAGDSVLAEFASAVEAVECAVEIQEELAVRNAALPDDHRLEFRIGINLGDVIVTGTDLHGDGVNVAARLQALAETGGVYVSGGVYDQVRGKLPFGYEFLGEQRVKNIAEPVRVYSVQRDVRTASDAAQPPPSRQKIRFATASDGVRIAYAATGRGPPLVKAANWLNHLDFDWHSPVWRHWIRELARDYRLIRYDERGNGLSDWEVADISFDAFVRDLEAVVDDAGLERFALLGISQGCAVSAAYAVRHRERVTHLVLYGGYAKGWRKRASSDDAERRQALLTLARQGWGQDNPAFRQVFTSLYIPEASAEQMRWFNDLQRVSTSPENAIRIMRVIGDIDVRPLLPQLRVPTLVLHCRGDAVAPFEEGRELAALTPGADFVPLEGRNHLLMGEEPAWPRFLAEVRSFLGSGEVAGLAPALE
jgi:class 3 adenylate cyclase/pimeloyl-ACP methyl ester carboxylesterase